MRQCRRSTSSTITAFAAPGPDHPPTGHWRFVSRCNRMATWNQSSIGGVVTPHRRDCAGPETTVGEGGQRRVPGSSDSVEIAADQLEVGAGFGDGAET
jgi:hypothetical protein